MIGQTIGHYLITAQLGAGGMGTVYRADDLRLKRAVAIKFVSPHLSRDPESHQRLLREARSASALDHPHIGVVHEVAETDDGQLYIVMALYEGGTLRQRLEQGPLPIDEALRLGRQITEGLAAAHAAGIVHRDLKPENILLTRDGQVRIVDFGLAKSRGQTRMTRTCSAAGTVAYMSPEQARGDEVDARTDLFSLGVILYEMLGGRPPFRGESDSAVLYQVVHEEPPELEGLRAEVPRSLRQLVTRLLAKDPSDRYPDATAVLADLGSGRVRRKWPRRRVLLAIVGTFAILGLSTWWAWPRYLSETARFKREIVRLQNDTRPLVIAVAAFAAVGTQADESAAALRAVCIEELNRLLSGDDRVQILAGKDARAVRTDAEARQFAKRARADVVLWANVLVDGAATELRPHVTTMPRVLVEKVAFSELSVIDDKRAPRRGSIQGPAQDVRSLAALVAAAYYALRSDSQRSLDFTRLVAAGSLELQLVRARLLAEQSFYQEAETLCRQLVVDYPLSADAHGYLGRVLLNLDRPQEAVDECRLALGMDPRNYLAGNYLAWSLDRLGRWSEAQAAFERVVDIATDNSNAALRIRGEALSRLRRSPEALACLKRAVALAPYGASHRSELARAYLYAEDYRAAQRELELALVIAPRGSFEHSLMVSVLLESGRLTDASEYLERNRGVLSAHGFRFYNKMWRVALLRRDNERAEAAGCSLVTLGNHLRYDSARRWLSTCAARGMGVAQAQMRAIPGITHADSLDDYTAVSRYMLDEISDAQLLDSAAAKDPILKNERLCEFQYFIGMRHLLAAEADGNSASGVRELAVKYLEGCVATDVRNFSEYADARLELDRLRGRKLK